MLQDSSSPSAVSPAFAELVANQPARVLALVAISVAGWGLLAWLALDMDSSLARLTMPMSPDWSAANVLAVWAMWSVMMVAMMLPAALPMMLTFAQVARRNGQPVRTQAFVAAYALVWLGFGAAGSAAQWALQRLDGLSPMAVSSSSALLSAVLLVLAGIYQFSPLKRVCLRSCRTPLAFLLGDWRPGVGGAFVMGLRHGALCLGCCWALMLLLFVGGVMNVAWVAALAVAVAIEKLAPVGEQVATLLGLALVAAGVLKLVAPGM
jgi:predicted metal-binding membrane protein